MGSIRDYYTPDGDKSYCKTLNEPCIIPRDTLNCFVAPVDDDEVKWMFLSFFNKDAIVGFTPPGSGCMKIFNFRKLPEIFPFFPLRMTIRFLIERLHLKTIAKGHL